MEMAAEFVRRNPGYSKLIAREVIRLGLLAVPRTVGLTQKQRQALEFIRGYIEKQGFSPSMEDIMFGINTKSRATAWKRVVALEERGYLTTAKNRSRSIQLTEHANVKK